MYEGEKILKLLEIEKGRREHAEVYSHFICYISVEMVSWHCYLWKDGFDKDWLIGMI